MIELKLEMATAGRGRNRRNLRSLRKLIAAATTVLGLLTMTAAARPQNSPEPSAQATKEARHAKKSKQAAKRRVIPVTISKGETYTISGLEKGEDRRDARGRREGYLRREG